MPSSKSTVSFVRPDESPLLEWPVDPNAKSSCVGLRVVRGPDWNLDGDSEIEGDGGGFVGTVVEFGGMSSSLPENMVRVQWDSGTRHDHQAGYNGAFELCVLDSAPIGIKHEGFTCRACKQSPILGMRWRCLDCKRTYIDLCTTCYMWDAHEKRHFFQRVDCPGVKGVSVGVRMKEEKTQAIGIYRWATVMRGPNWMWDDKDGGKGQEGVVQKITDWQGTPSSAAVVSLDSANKETYRLGYQGKVDLRCIDAGLGGYYYKAHLPRLGDNATSSKVRRPLNMSGKTSEHLSSGTPKTDLGLLTRPEGTVTSKTHDQPCPDWQERGRHNSDAELKITKATAAPVNAAWMARTCTETDQVSAQAGVPKQQRNTPREERSNCKEERCGVKFSGSQPVPLEESRSASVPIPAEESSIGDPQYSVGSSSVNQPIPPKQRSIGNSLRNVESSVTLLPPPEETRRSGSQSSVGCSSENQLLPPEGSVECSATLPIPPKQSNSGDSQRNVDSSYVSQPTPPVENTSVDSRGEVECSESLPILPEGSSSVEPQSSVESSENRLLPPEESNDDLSRCSVDSSENQLIPPGETSSGDSQGDVERSVNSSLWIPPEGSSSGHPQCDVESSTTHLPTASKDTIVASRRASIVTAVSPKCEMCAIEQRRKTEEAKASRGPLHKAAIKGHLETVKTLLDDGADVDPTDKFSLTPLHLAVWYGQEKIVKVLLEHGANVNALDRFQKTPLQKAERHNHRCIVELLLKNNATPTLNQPLSLRTLSSNAFVAVDRRSGFNRLQAAALEGLYNTILAACVLLRKDFIVEMEFESTANNSKKLPGRTAFEIILEHKDEQHNKVKEFYRQEKEKLHTFTKLHLCASHGDEDPEMLVEYVVEKDMDVNVPAQGNRTPLLVASLAASSTVIDTLINLGADPFAQRDDTGTPLLMASYWNNYMASHLITASQPGAEIIRHCEKNVLHEAVSYGHFHLSRLLIRSGCSVNVKNSYGRTPLHVAVNSGRIRLVELLLESGADVKARNLLNIGERVYLVRGTDKGKAAWHYVLVDKPLMGLFLKRTSGGNLDVANFGAVLDSGWGRDPPKSKKDEIDTRFDPRSSDTEDLTALHLACQKGDFGIMDSLVRHRADVNALDADGYTALHVAAIRGREEVVRKLVELKADINLVTHDGSDAAKLATLNEESEIADYLNTLKS